MANDPRVIEGNELPLTVVDARPAWQLLDWRELWQYRELLYRFALRDVTVRYKSAVIGAAWVVFQPLVTMLIFTSLFSLLGQTPTTGKIPYSLFLFCGLLPWQLFSTTTTQSCTSLVANQHLITKAYFPRMILPMATIVCGLLDFAVGMGLFVLMMICFGIVPTWATLAFPVFVLMTLVISLAVGLWLAALNAIYRDVGYVFPFCLQIGFYLTPVIYETHLVPEHWRTLYSLNPLVGILEGFRWSLLGAPAPSWGILVTSFAGVCLLLVGGLLNFHKMERVFADRI